jgi:uncharacterized protein YceK
MLSSFQYRTWLESLHSKPGRRKMNRSIALVAAVIVGMSGCATILADDRDTISIASQRPGASILINGAPRGTTPMVVELDSTRSHTVTIQTQDGQFFTCELYADIGAGWVVADILLTGFVGLVIDAATGAWKSLDRDTCVAPI